MKIFALFFLFICLPLRAEISFSREGGRLEVKVGGELFTEYHSDSFVPCLYPLMCPDGTDLTRQFPFVKGVAGEEMDHPHHIGFWFAHGRVIGLDFWHSKPNHPPSRRVHGGEKRLWLPAIGSSAKAMKMPRRGWKSVDAGEVVLGRNQLGGSGGESMYQVFLKGADTEETTAAAVEPLLAKADKTRGEEIFFGRGTCFACHQVKGRGMVIGPEHSGRPSFAHTLSPQDVADITAWIMDLK